MYIYHTSLLHEQDGYQKMAARHTYSLSDRHETILQRLAKKLDTSLVNTMERALESLEEKEARRDKEIAG